MELINAIVGEIAGLAYLLPAATKTDFNKSCFSYLKPLWLQVQNRDFNWIQSRSCHTIIGGVRLHTTVKLRAVSLLCCFWTLDPVLCVCSEVLF